MQALLTGPFQLKEFTQSLYLCVEYIKKLINFMQRIWNFINNSFVLCGLEGMKKIVWRN